MSKIVVLSTGDVNGAYEAAHRIVHFAVDAGHEAVLIVKTKTKTDRFIVQVKQDGKNSETSIIRRALNRIPYFGKAKAYRTPATKPKYLFLDEDETQNVFSTASILRAFPFTPELIIVGMTNGFTTSTNLSELQKRSGAKLVLLTTDMFPLTGGCHYAWECSGYEKDCSQCPATVNVADRDWPKKNLAIKKLNFENIPISIFSMSGWSNLQVQRSSLLKNRNILLVNSLVDVKIFNRDGRGYAKHFFGIPEGAKAIFIGSQSLNDERKGVTYIVDALNHMANGLDPELKDKTIVMLIGRDLESVQQISSMIPFKKHFIPYITDYRLLSLLYQAADVFVCGSVEDTGPMMVSEALSCGTPVVGFNTGVAYNIIENGKNGSKVPVKDSVAMGNGIAGILAMDNESFEAMSRFANQKIEKESSAHVVVDAIREVLSSKQ